MSGGPEFIKVEQPLIDQLISMGWKYTTGSTSHPSVTDRDSFREVLLRDDLEKALRRINPGPDGQPWLDASHISTAVAAIERPSVARLMEANQAVSETLLKGVSVEGLPDWDNGRTQTIHFIDWQNPENNTFRAVNQYRVDEPGGQAHLWITPDVVLFVNGIPLVVIECKAPSDSEDQSEPMEEAIKQLQRYSNQRHWFDGNEGNERLFWTNQFNVATCYDEARVGTIGAMAVHFMEWKDTSPVPMDDVAALLGKDTLSSQEKLVAGMLRPANLLDIIRHFILFDRTGGKTIKKVCRYQQFRAVQESVNRLKTGKTRSEDGEQDRRGGIVWHTQGSGKSLTMVFLVRKMRTDRDLRRFKVVIVTDRKNLEKQLSETAALTGENVKVARRISKVKNLLAEKGPGLVFAMIQKYREKDPDLDDFEIDDLDAIADSPEDVGDFPELNTDESILVLVDEAHRSHGSALHGNLLHALPNCARIGFTGTPIIMGKRKKTFRIFGTYIDRYQIKQSEEDGATVPILYDGRTASGAVKDGGDLDELFEDMLREYTPEQMEAIRQKYGTKGNVVASVEMIRAKARDMLRHYIENVLPNGFKAQVVSISRLAAVRYYEAFLEARDALVTEVEALDGRLIEQSDEDMGELTRRQMFLVRAHRYLGLIKALEFAPVFSGSHNDPPGWAEWSDRTKSDIRIEAFKKPFPSPENDDPTKASPLAFLIVKSMLLTGFDAPVEQVMYLDRHIKEAELLQAIARVNRTNGPKKTPGLVVDYYGIAQHLHDAMKEYSEEDVEGTWVSLKDEIPKLRDRHRRAVDLFVSRGVDLTDTEACIKLLKDEKLRAEFHVLLKAFLSTLDLVLPRPEGLPYIKDAKTLSTIYTKASRRYRDARPIIGQDVGEKVRKLIDDHIVGLGIDQTIPPIEITDDAFSSHVDSFRSDEAKASEMEHALRHTIRKHMDEDPEHYEQLSKRLDRILTELKDQWEQLVIALRDLVEDVHEGRQHDDTGLDPETQAPFLGVLKLAVCGDREADKDELERLCKMTVELVEHIRREICLVEFWSKTQAQEDLHGWIVQTLDDHDILPWEQLPELADRLVELAKVNHPRLTA